MGKSRIDCSIEDLRDDEALRECERLQREVWGFQTPDIVSVRMLRTCVEHGGILLGASVASRGIIGFVFSFSAYWGELKIQHSHMLAVLPEFQNSGIGVDLKLAQLNRAKARGVKIITWTFDPLECRNAHLNLNKLGVVVRRYYKNLYGESTTSELHSGLGTDRFLAEWYLDGAAPTESLSKELPQPIVLTARSDESGLPLPGAVRDSHGAGRLFLEIPWNIQEVKLKDRVLALEWRQATRNLLTRYLSSGEYEIDALIRYMPDAKTKRAFYRLKRMDGRRRQ